MSIKEIVDKHNLSFNDDEYKYEHEIVTIFNDKELNANRCIPDDMLINCKGYILVDSKVDIY